MVSRRTLNNLCRSAVLAVAAGAALGCPRNPATGERQLSFISEGQEIQMGKEYDPQVVATMGLYDDSGLQRYVRDLGARLAAASERPELPWTFRVIDDPVVNAFALPGGFIYITRGILAHFNSEAELASVLGHEIGHVTARHSVEQLSRQQLAQAGLVVGMIISPEVARFGQVASAALSVLFLKYGRDDERQADDLGLRYMRRLSYDAHEMPDVFTMLEQVSASQQGGRIPEWLSTHPDPGNRRERIQQEIAKLPAESLGTVSNREELLRRVEGIVYGTNPREGYFKNGEFFHPDLRFRMRFPEGWPAQNQKQGVVAMSTERDAMIQLTLAKQQSADAAAQAFFSQQGVISGRASRSPVNGLRAVIAPFGAQTETGALRGAAAFIEHGGKVFQLLAVAPEPRWAAYASTAERIFLSFSVLTDRAILDAQPMRVQIITVPRAMTLAALASERPAPVPVAPLALLNGLSADASLQAGQKLKWVTGRPLP